MMNEYKVYIIGNKRRIEEMLQFAQQNEVIDSYQIEES